MPAKTSPPPINPQTPHYHGHRERLRERFYTRRPGGAERLRTAGDGAIPGVPRRDTKPLAKALLKKFGSFAEVIHAPVARLREVEGIGEASINQIKLLAAAATGWRRARSSARSRCRPGTT